jgi:proline dehydrogenase
MISFDNTETAFKHKSNSELRKAWWLFTFIGNNQLVKLSKPFAGIAASLPPTRWIIQETIYAHFCGGTSIRNCEKTIANLAASHVGTILDYSVEGKESEADFDRTCDEIQETQNRALLDDHVPFCVFKLTGLARFALLEKVSNGTELTESERHEFNNVRNRVERLCKKAFDDGTRIMMDAEESWIQPVMDDLMLDMMLKYNRERAVVYNTFQMYRHDRLVKLKELLEKAKSDNFVAGVKLVRGAYMEKERKRAAEQNYTDPIQANKISTDTDYNAALQFMVESIQYCAFCAGTHNEESSALLVKLMIENKIEPGDKRIFFSQLLGMSDHISFNLAATGYNVVKYVPYGPVKEVLPYLIRRAEENTSVAGQTGRELDLLTREKKRRQGRVRQ